MRTFAACSSLQARAVFSMVLVFLVGCSTPAPREHMEAVEQLVADGPAPVAARFKPVTPEERLDILGENGYKPY
ncbi:MAG: hypothetical protein P1V36_16375, partial [Planctomycetota bacterium]|nr:hypothetical protein [Planctomycetota bacterium]